MAQGSIGLTEDDTERKARTKKINDLVESTRKDIEEAITKYDPVCIVTLTPLDFMREAYSCYQNGAFMAATAMCRAATELVVYLAVTRRVMKPSTFGGGSEHMDISLIEKNWGSISTEAKEYGIIDGKLIDQINKVRSKANTVLHHGQRRDKALSQGAITGFLSEEEAHEAIKSSLSIITQVVINQGQNSNGKSKPKNNDLLWKILIAELAVAVIMSIVFFSGNLGSTIGEIIVTSSYNTQNLASLLEGILAFGGIIFGFSSLVGLELIKESSKTAKLSPIGYYASVVAVVGVLLMLLVAVSIILGSLALFLGNNISSTDITQLATSLKTAIYFLYFASGATIGLVVLYAFIRHMNS